MQVGDKMEDSRASNQCQLKRSISHGTLWQSDGSSCCDHSELVEPACQLSICGWVNCEPAQPEQHEGHHRHGDDEEDDHDDEENHLDADTVIRHGDSQAVIALETCVAEASRRVSVTVVAAHTLVAAQRSRLDALCKPSKETARVETPAEFEIISTVGLRSSVHGLGLCKGCAGLTSGAAVERLKVEIVNALLALDD